MDPVVDEHGRLTPETITEAERIFVSRPDLLARFRRRGSRRFFVMLRARRQRRRAASAEASFFTTARPTTRPSQTKTSPEEVPA